MSKAKLLGGSLILMITYSQAAGEACLSSLCRTLQKKKTTQSSHDYDPGVPSLLLLYGYENRDQSSTEVYGSNSSSDLFRSSQAHDYVPQTNDPIVTSLLTEYGFPVGKKKSL